MPAAERSATLDGLVAEGARRMLAAALEAEVDDYLARLADQRDEHGRRLVVRNGHGVIPQGESTFATVRLRTKVTKGPGSRAGGLAMPYNLIGPVGGRSTPRSWSPSSEPV